MPAPSLKYGKDPLAETSIVLFIPMFNCASQISRLLARLAGFDLNPIQELVVIDNKSEDDGAAKVRDAFKMLEPRLKTTLIVNSRNLGFGGSHKVAFSYCLEKGYEYCAVLHGDDQARLEDFHEIIKMEKYKSWDHCRAHAFPSVPNFVGILTSGP